MPARNGPSQAGGAAWPLISGRGRPPNRRIQPTRPRCPDGACGHDWPVEIADDGRMARYRIAALVAFKPLVVVPLVEQFAEYLVAAFESEVSERTKVEVGVLQDNATVHVTMVSRSVDAAREDAENLIRDVATANELVIERLDFGKVIDEAPFV